MRIFKGFHLRKHLVRIIPRACRRRNRYHKLDSFQLEDVKTTANSNSRNWCQWVRRKARQLCSVSKQQQYGRVEDFEEKKEPVPKGHLAVYVKNESGEVSRLVVPVMYFNHPLFGELLKEAEQEFGYDHPGGIQIPCRVSEFEMVKTRIERSGGGRKVEKNRVRN